MFAFGLLAGFFGAMASIFAKFAFTQDDAHLTFVMRQLDNFAMMGTDKLQYVIRAVFFVGMFVLNSLMLRFYVRAMRDSSSLLATVQSTASNLLFTALFSYLIFGESLSCTGWWIGSMFIAVGLGLMFHGDSIATAAAGTGKQQKQE